VPRFAIQAIVASSVAHTSSAVRPDGKVIVTVSTQSGMPFDGARF
jgi:LytS/YehU family sensor histidine kinase